MVSLWSLQNKLLLAQLRDTVRYLQLLLRDDLAVALLWTTSPCG